jgi:hypothetical protein
MTDLKANKYNKLIVRYCLLCDDTSFDTKDISRVAELVCSLLSLKLYLLPYVEHEIVCYTEEAYLKRLEQIFSLIGISSFHFILLNDKEDFEFSQSLKYASPVDRICVRRMLKDFRELSSENFRLLMGNDCYFFSKPNNIFDFMEEDYTNSVMYMIDNLTFLGMPYHLRYSETNILRGLLGDFYCLSPNVSLCIESIMSYLRTIDSWPPLRRWRPDLPKFMSNKTHACEQQCAAILLAKYKSFQLPSSTYNHLIPKVNCVLLHSHAPWLNIFLEEMPVELRLLVKEYWSILGYNEIIRLTQEFEINHLELTKRRIKQQIWQVTDYLPDSFKLLYRAPQFLMREFFNQQI